MDKRNPPKLFCFCWYRIKGQVIYCIRYTETWQENGIHVDMEGIRPQDYAAYVTHMFLGENEPPYRTIAEIKDIPMPDPVRISFLSTAKIEEVRAKDVFSAEEQPEQKRAITERLLALWLEKPALRLGQLLDDAHAGPLLYYIEDEALIELLEMFVVGRKK
jgi:hypothetical protein